MTFRNTRVPMGKLFGPSEYQWGIANESRARTFRQLANESSR